MYSNVGAVTNPGYPRSKTKEIRDRDREGPKDTEANQKEQRKEPISTRLLKFIKRRINPEVQNSCQPATSTWVGGTEPQQLCARFCRFFKMYFLRHSYIALYNLRPIQYNDS